MRILISFCTVWMMAIAFVSGQILSVDQIKTEPTSITTGFSFKLHSVVLNEDRLIKISLPDGYSTTTKKYPVLYMIDGQWNFNHGVQTVGWLSEKAFIPQTIVVAINTLDNRVHDLTPTPNKESKEGGGSDKLCRFIKEELIPFIDKNYRTFNYRVLDGVSLGGLFVMSAFVSDPQLYSGYIAQSPSMWWDNRIMLDKTKDFLVKNPNFPNYLFLAMANEGTGMGVDSLALILKQYASKELFWKYEKYPDEVHETVSFLGTWNGLKFVFTDWYYPLVNFGTKENLFSPNDSVVYISDNHNLINLSSEILSKYCGLYLDSYKRVIAITEADNTLTFSSKRLPALTLYPEAGNKFFMKEADVRDKLFLKGIDICFEFIKDDSLLVTANGKVDCTAKKLNHTPFVMLSSDGLKRFVGTYLSSDQSSVFDVVTDGNTLKMSEKEEPATTLYPVGEHRFFAFIDGSGYECEFINDETNGIMKLSVFEDGKPLFEAKKKN